jgi:3-oxoadipate enol-lactonase
MRTRHIQAGDTTLAVTEAGDGAPIVFLHAFPLDARMWTPQLSTLPDRWRGVAPDLRGFGQSVGQPPARAIGDHAADVLALIDAVQGGPVVLAGLSMGGYIAFECWRRRPTAVRALVLADTRAEADTDEARAKRVKMQALAQASGATAVIDAMLPNLLGATTQTGNPHLAQEVRGWAAATPASGIVDALEVLRTRPDSRPTLSTITCPTLVIVGREDALTPPSAAQVMRDGIAGARYVEIAEAGHLANVEQPQAFNAALHAFLARL